MKVLIGAVRPADGGFPKMFRLGCRTHLTFEITIWSFCVLPTRGHEKIPVALGSCHQPFDLSLPP